MDFLPNNLQQALNEKREFRLGDYLQQGFDIAKQNFGGFIGYFFVYMIIIFALFITVLGIIPCMLMVPALSAGFFVVAHKIHNKQPYEFKDFFGAFSHWKNLLFVSILTGILVLMAALPYYYYNFGGLDIEGLISAMSSENPDPAIISEIVKENSERTSIGVSYLLQTPIYAINALFISAPFLVLFFNLSAIDAMKVSFNLGLKYFWWLILTNILLGLLAGLSILLCVVGVLFASAIVICTHYSMLADLTGLNNENTDDDITQHFIAQ